MAASHEIARKGQRYCAVKSFRCLTTKNKRLLLLPPTQRDETRDSHWKMLHPPHLQPSPACTAILRFYIALVYRSRRAGRAAVSQRGRDDYAFVVSTWNAWYRVIPISYHKYLCRGAQPYFASLSTRVPLSSLSLVSTHSRHTLIQATANCNVVSRRLTKAKLGSFTKNGDQPIFPNFPSFFLVKKHSWKTLRTWRRKKQISRVHRVSQDSDIHWNRFLGESGPQERTLCPNFRFLMIFQAVDNERKEKSTFSNFQTEMLEKMCFFFFYNWTSGETWSLVESLGNFCLQRLFNSWVTFTSSHEQYVECGITTFPFAHDVSPLKLLHKPRTSSTGSVQLFFRSIHYRSAKSGNNLSTRTRSRGKIYKCTSINLKTKPESLNKRRVVVYVSWRNLPEQSTRIINGFPFNLPETQRIRKITTET